jgi:hypothetical protein
MIFAPLFQFEHYCTYALPKKTSQHCAWGVIWAATPNAEKISKEIENRKQKKSKRQSAIIAEFKKLTDYLITACCIILTFS